MSLVGIDMLLGDDVLMTNQYVERVVVAVQNLLEVVVGRVGVAEAMAVGIGDTDGRHVLHVDGGHIFNIIGGETPEALVVLGVVVVAKLGLQAEVVVDFPSEGTGDVEVLAILLAVVVALHLQGVVEVTQLIVGTTCRSIEVLQGERSIEDGIAQTVVGVVGTRGIVGTTTADVGVGIACLEVERCALGGLGVQLQREVIALEVRTYLDGLVVHVGVAEGILDVLRTTIDVDVVVEGVARAAIDEVLPVVGLDVVIHVDVLIVSEVVGVGGNLLRIVAVLQQGELILPCGIVASADDVDLLGHLLPGVVGIVADLGLAFLTALGGDEDYTISTTRTVDGGGGCILQDGDVLNVVGRDVADTVNGEAIDDVERVVRLGDGATSTHADLHLCIGRTLSGGDLHTRHLTREGLGSVCHGHCLQHIAVDGSYGTRKVFFLHRAVTDDHHVVQTCGLVVEHYIYIALVGNVDSLRLHTYV